MGCIERSDRVGAAADELMAVVVSRLVGSASGERRFVRPLCVAVAGIGWIDGGRRAGEPAPVSGWPDPRSVLRGGAIAPAFLDELWQRAVAEDGDLAVLPAGLLDALLPSAVWGPLAAVAEMGPVIAQQRLERFCRLETLRRGRTYAGRQVPVSAGSIDRILTSARRLFACLSWCAHRQLDGGRLAGWLLLPPPVSAAELGALPAALDRSAPPVQLVRDVLERLDRQALHNNPRLRRQALRDRVLLGLLASTGARIGAISRLRVDDIDTTHRFPDDTRGPAIALRPGKALPDQQVRWKAIPAELQTWITTYTATVGLRIEQPLFPRGNDATEIIPRAPESLTRIFSGSSGRPGLLPRTGAGGYSAHTLRHLAAQLAHIAARNDSYAPTPEALVAALLDHRHGRDPLGYLDTTSEPQRELLARHATHHIWKTLRGQQRDADSAVEQLRNRRQQLLAKQPATTSDKLTTLIDAASLTAQIDDTLAATRIPSR